ncbi:MAG: hypothetical protein IJO85_06070 [Lachnospiraceae bacterium]|nr:hypothetical protein [Lachnospiraceae bacterium]
MLCRKQSGYITVYLTFTFAIILSLLLALVEGAAMGAARLQAELVADLGMDSIFAEYHRELFSQYGLLFIDDSYGTKKGSLSKIEKHLSEYMSYNLNPQKGLTVVPGSNWIGLENIYLEIEEAAFATDDAGAVWKAQAIDYVKCRYGIDIIKGIQGQLQTIEKSQLLSEDMSQSLAKYQKEFEETLVTEEITETDRQTQEGFSYDLLKDFFDSFTGKGILYLAVSKPETLSTAVMERKDCLSYRAQQKNINKGSGLPEYVEEPEGLIQELLFGEFLLEKYGFYGQEKENSHLKYQLEYILYGRDNDISNLRESAERLLWLRTGANYLYLTTKDSVKIKEVELASTAICSLLGIPQAADVLAQLIILLWVIAESIYDVKCLLEGGEVPLVKKQGEWKLSLAGIFRGELWGKNADMTYASGISYEGYLRIFLALMINQEDKAMRSMDMAELDIRRTAGNEHFRMDQCVDHLKITFGFMGDREQEYVFTRSMRYE